MFSGKFPTQRWRVSLTILLQRKHGCISSHHTTQYTYIEKIEQSNILPHPTLSQKELMDWQADGVARELSCTHARTYKGRGLLHEASKVIHNEILFFIEIKN